MNEDVVIPLAAIALPAILVPTILAFRQVAKKREFQHLERMKALETGQPVPGEAMWPAAVACASIGAGVPLGSFLFTWLASVSAPHLPAEIWIAPVIVSFVALMSSMALAGAMQRHGKAPAPGPLLNGKPMMHDPDAYDVAGSRG